MLAIPEMDGPDVVFGNIKHMPQYRDLPEEFRDWHYHPICCAASHWFMSGAEMHPEGIKIKDDIFTAKPGVDANKALRAIRAVMTSWTPKHEHKIAACGYMLSEWFDKKPT